MSESVGVIWSSDGSFNYGVGGINSSSPKRWQAQGSFSNPYNFLYYQTALRNQSINRSSSFIGSSRDLDRNYTVYSYSSSGITNFTLDPALSANLADPGINLTTVVFLIDGSLTVDYEFYTERSAIFIAKNDITIEGNLDGSPDPDNPDRISGLYVAGERFIIRDGPSQFILDGMTYANSFSFEKTSYRSLTSPTYQFIYQPKYLFDLLPYLGRSQVIWKEVGP